MKPFLNGLVYKEYPDVIGKLSNEDLAILRVAMRFELHTANEVRQVLRARVEEVLRKLGKIP